MADRLNITLLYNRCNYDVQPQRGRKMNWRKHPEAKALLECIHEKPDDLAPRLILSDWLEEHDFVIDAFIWRSQHIVPSVDSIPIQLNDVECSGHGDGFGDGTSNGIGEGEEYVGDCRSSQRYGDGAGYGNGKGDDDKFGDGVCYGFGGGEIFGSGSGEGEDGRHFYKKTISTKEQIVIGKQMLILSGRGFAWVGRVEEMYAPGCYRLSSAGMLCSTGFASWMDLAGGEKRDGMVYRRSPNGEIFLGPEIHAAIEWHGDLPDGDVG
jgi:uncharacterized protein (TIGR02996 family)